MNEAQLQGHLHPISSLIREINQIFFRMGFTFAEGPLLESEKYNFDLLNVPKDHPARDMQDTFFIKDEPGYVMRTHTSPVQVRYMEKHKPPIRVIVPGKAFRNEATDITHEAEFFQLEGLMIDEGIHLGHLKGVLEQFFKELFRGSVEVRFRPSFFPFVEPGVEVDMRITGESAPPKLRDRWIEIMGAGEVHPRVIENAGLDPKKYQGFAFGMGIDRLALLRYGIDDIRHIHSADLRFINQF
jgi:phenylalanyl-tRNA synthetase alpha chain